MTDSDLNLDIGVRNAPVRHLACLHHRGPYVGDTELFEGLFARLRSWATGRGMDAASLGRIAVFHNDPELTSPEELRMSVCLEVPEGVAPDGEIEALELPGGTWVVAAGTLHFRDHGTAWRQLMEGWLPPSGWRPARGPLFEVIREFAPACAGRHHAQLWAPVEPVQGRGRGE